MSPAETMRTTLAAWPQGWFTAEFRGLRYGVSNTSHAGGRSLKLYAEELGGSDFVSLNLYTPELGDPTLRPCEMPVEKVLEFVAEARPVAGRHHRLSSLRRQGSISPPARADGSLPSQG
jgi:hypothetical protein